MKMRWPRGKKHVDQDKIDERKNAKEDLRMLLLLGDEEGYVQLIKQLQPQITPAALSDLVLRFREDRRKMRLGS